MRRLAGIATLLLVASAGAPSSAAAQSGGASPPAAGGHAYGQPTTSPPPRAPRLRASVFTVTPNSVTAGTELRFGYRVDGRPRRVRVRIDLVPADGHRAATRLRLGSQPTGQALEHAWTPRPGELPAGRYVARLAASGARGARLRRTARASGRSPLEIVAQPPAVPPSQGVFPVQGPYSFGAEDARFGAARSGHVHQGQDVIAPEGTPIVSPRAGFVYWLAYQASGAGHYVVVRGDDGRDYVFMHLQDGSVAVVKDQPVTAGQILGGVGNTGDSHGAHLHFEIWPDGWFSSDASQPIDPLPDLMAWAAPQG
jgi:murein DD-endopeptidase MepM/ murein hydrolase activator NlpD